MNITKSTMSFTCPDCGQTTSYDLSIHDLAEGHKLVCGKCGRELVVDKNMFAKAEEMLEHTPASNLFSTSTAIKSSMSFQCPACKKTTTTDLTVGRLTEGEKVFCSHCGKEIPVDREKFQNVEKVLDRLGVPGGTGEASTIDTPDGPVVVKTKTFNVDFKTNIDIGRKDLPGAGSPGVGSPILTPRKVIEPKGGCLGVWAVLAFSTMFFLVYGFFG